MKVEDRDSYDKRNPCVLTLGTFDGVHLGHQEVLRQVVSYARKNFCRSVLFTFDPHPLELIQPQSGVTRLFSIDKLKNFVKSIGIDEVVVEKFSKEFAQVSASTFVEKYIYEKFKPSCIFAGYDLKFGKNREGDIKFLKKYAQKLSFQVQEVSPVYFEERIISSSWIRDAFRRSDFVQLKKLRGRAFCLEGEVISGDSRGSRLGFPTANIHTSCRLPQKGVYICQLSLHEKTYPAVMNIGVNPTFTSSKELKVEVHLINHKLSLRGKKVELSVLKKLRDEQKFQDIPSLKNQIQLDVQKSRLYFSENKGLS